MKTSSATTDTLSNKIVSKEEWIKAHAQHREKGIALTKMREQLSQERRDLPWEKVTENYLFDGPNGKVALADLFDGRSQLFVYHFMYGPDWEEGCAGCSFIGDHVDGARIHFEQADLSFVAISRAPLSKLQAFEKRMGWHFPWVSSFNNNFNFDYFVSYTQEDLDKGPVFRDFKMRKINSPENHGVSVFYKDEQGDIYHTYSTFGRGCEMLIGAFNFLDLVPKGRNENGEVMPWVKLHDQYPNQQPSEAANNGAKSCCH
jgi:predicted dithiol-disulfide oxidoreductase (DUF899 family)